MLISALCNLAVMVALGLVTVAAQENWGGLKLTVEAGAGDSNFIDDSQLTDQVELSVSPDTAAAMGPVSLFADSSIPVTDVAALEALSDSAAPLAGFDGLAMGGGAEGNASSGPAATEFFGIGGYGQTFVYVVDASGSMNEAGKFQRAKYELLHSIEQLASDQRFFIIFFNHGAYPMNAREPVLATKDALADATAWIESISPDGGTVPLPALLHALSLRPDAIYFLSDGQFDPVTLRVLRARNHPTKHKRHLQIPIHTISLMDHATISLMRTISRDSNGEHRFVK